MAKDKNFIAKATANNKGAFRKAMGAKKGQDIPLKKEEKAEHSKNPKLRKEAVLAVTLRRLHKGK